MIIKMKHFHSGMNISQEIIIDFDKYEYEEKELSEFNINIVKNDIEKITKNVIVHEMNMKRGE